MIALEIDGKVVRTRKSLDKWTINEYFQLAHLVTSNNWRGNAHYKKSMDRLTELYDYFSDPKNLKPAAPMYFLRLQELCQLALNNWPGGSVIGQQQEAN